MAVTNLTPRQRLAAGSAAAVVAVAGLFLTPFEGTIFRTYPDPVHKWRVPTACTGHTGPELRAGQTFTKDECNEMLNADLRGIYDGLATKACIGDVPLPDHELAAYLSLGFNGGPAMVCGSSIVAKLKAGDHAAACATITDFTKVRVKGVLVSCYDPVNNCPGIVRRRAAERAMCEGAS